MSHRNIRGGTVNVNMYVFSGNVVDVAILDQPQEDRTIRANKMKGATTAISSSRGGGAIRVALCLHVVGVARGLRPLLLLSDGKRDMATDSAAAADDARENIAGTVQLDAWYLLNIYNKHAFPHFFLQSRKSRLSVAPPFPPRHPPLLCALTKRNSPLWWSKVTSFLYSITAFQLTFGSLLNFACGIGGSRIST
jgi:hypothetical protein